MRGGEEREKQREGIMFNKYRNKKIIEGVLYI